MDDQKTNITSQFRIYYYERQSNGQPHQLGQGWHIVELTDDGNARWIAGGFPSQQKAEHDLMGYIVPRLEDGMTLPEAIEEDGDYYAGRDWNPVIVALSPNSRFAVEVGYVHTGLEGMNAMVEDGLAVIIVDKMETSTGLATMPIRNIAYLCLVFPAFEGDRGYIMSMADYNALRGVPLR